MNLRTWTLKDFPIDSKSLHFAQEISDLPGVKGVQLLPDTFTKAKYLNLNYKLTIPSSSAIVTGSDILYPQFRSRGIHCGMMAVALPLSEKDLTLDFTESLMQALTFDVLYYSLYRFRLPFLPRSTDLNYEQFITTLEGNAVTLKEVEHLLNPAWLQKRTVRMRHAVGTYFGGNHFFELQVAQTDAPNIGVHEGQIVAMYHTGCQGIQDLIRPDLAERYFYQPKYTATRQGEEMYEAFFVAQGMLERYIDHYRNTTKQIIDSILEHSNLPASRTLANRSHNNVTQEAIDGEQSLVYRHNAESFYFDEIALISGMYNHNSYLVRGGSHTAKTYHTIDHGLGKVLARDKNQSVVADKAVELRRYHTGLYRRSSVTTTPLQSSEYVTEYFDQLAAEGVAEIAATLRPIVNMKYTK